MKHVICIVCPTGCRLAVDEERDCAVTGNRCPRGEAYGRAEVLHPVRMITSTVRVAEGPHPRCPVKTAAPLPKELMFQAMALLDRVELHRPVRAGQPVVRNICGTGIDFIATRDL